MNSRAIIWNAIRDVDNDGITPVSINSWTRKAAIDRLNIARNTIGGESAGFNIPPVLNIN